ncbi:ABC transporter ATP-binding protein, partial [bacterium]|nr:ABC transporter ATP-binding protein [bacterium]
CLNAVGILDRGDDLYGSYSHGMKQRLGIAWAILMKPELVILDEPLNGLDPPAILLIRGLIRDLAAKAGATVLLSSHLLHEVELGCDRVAIIERGKLIAEGTVESLLHPEREVLEVECDDLDAAAGVARALPFVAAARIEPSARERRATAARPKVLVVELEHGRSAELNRGLVESGRAVATIVPRRRTLEELFHDRLAETRRRDRLEQPA